MREKDHIEDYFRKHLEHYEESPDEDFWASVAPALEVQKERNNYRLLWILLLFLSLLLTGFLVKSIAWDQDLEFGKKEARVPIIVEDVPIDDWLDLEDETPIIKEKKSIQKEQKVVKQNPQIGFTEAKQLNQFNEKENIEVLTEVAESEGVEAINYTTTRISSVPKIQLQALELLPDKIAELNYVAPELAERRRPLRVQPYVTLNSYALQSIIYESVRQFNGMTTDRLLSAQINTVSNIGLGAGVTLNEQFYIQVGFNQDFGKFTYKETIGKNISEQEIAIMADGIPINFDFTMNPYFDEIEGRLKLTPKTSEIEAGDKFFSIEAQRRVQTTRWTFATAYKIDVSNIIRLTPKIGVSSVNTKYQPYERILGKEILLDPDGKEVDNQLNTEISINSTGEVIQLKNTEWLLGFQAEIPMDKQGKWMLVPMAELWFDTKPILENSDLKLQRSVLTLGVGLRYLIR
ncbi:MAG: hypothetical protein AAF806_21885 [Bacteroidota bacterium]